MALLCFLLDLRSLPPSLLRDLKQCLLQLANLYAISKSFGSAIPRARIGLCYVQFNRASCSDELKFAYVPRGDFSLRDFHHAVNNLPTDCFSIESAEFGSVKSCNLETTLARLLSKEAMYSWVSKDILRKVIFINSCLLPNISTVRKILTDAAEQCVSVEFVLLEQGASQVEDMSDNVEEFSNSISDLENCLLHRYFPDAWILRGLIRRWLQEVKDEAEGSRQAIIVFKNDLVESTNQVFCNLFASTNLIIDGFNTCEACRCHGLPTGDSNKMKGPNSCPITFHELGDHNLIKNVVKVGETVLFLPSFQCFPKLQQASSPIIFNVMECTSLASLSEEVMLGTSYIATPLASHEIEAATDVHDSPELNVQFFHGLSRALRSLDQGLVCSSNCNTETMREATFQCFYVLQPSDKGPMLLRRLAGAEEILPFPNVVGSTDSSVQKKIEDSIQASLSKLELRDYNPLLHERGLHPKLNCLVKESLHFGALPKYPRPRHTKAFTQPPTNEKASDDYSRLTRTPDEDNTSSNITEEWEQLIVHEIRESFSPTCVSKSKSETSILSSDSRPLDEKTTRILERLEAPKQRKTKGSSPVIVSNVNTDMRGPMKKPLVPFGPNKTGQETSLSQPIKPTFHKLKRKLGAS